MEVAGGIYSHYLGSVTPLDISDFASIVYVAVKVGSFELFPRSELTYAPYTLASAGVAGQENVIPSIGTAGIGTNSPDSDFELHIKDGDGDGRLLVEGNDRGSIEFRKGGQEASIGYHSAADNDFRFFPGQNKTLFHWGNTVKAAILSTGMEIDAELKVSSASKAMLEFDRFNVSTASIGIPDGADYLALRVRNLVGEEMRMYSNGDTEIRGGLIVSGGVAHSNGNHWYMNSGGTGGSGGGGTTGAAIYAIGDIHAGTFRAFSDYRIKHNFRLSDPVADLDRLMQLRVTDYQYIDVHGKGEAVKKGVIAQEVEKIFPEAVQQSTDFIPNIYTLTDKIRLENGRLMLQMDKAHGLQAGDELRLIMESGSKDVVVEQISDALTFSVAWEEETPAKIFVYGKKVSDFRQVDYDQLHTLTISATQALVRRVEELERENNRLHDENKGLRSDIEGLDARMQRLERTAATSSLVKH